MGELERIVLTSGLTILGGFIIYVLGQVFSKLLFDPSLEVRRVIGEIGYALVYHADVISNPGKTRDDLMKATSDNLRQLAGKIFVAAKVVPWYGLMARIRILPRMNDLDEAARKLLLLSNSIYSGEGRQNIMDSKEVHRLLGLPYF